MKSIRLLAARYLLSVALGTLAANSVYGQAVPVPANPKSDQEKIELSPFVIVAENETGWVATNSLAGSRLNTSLKDIAASLEVLTKDFMDDFGLATFEEVALYTTNVEGIREGYESTDGEGLAQGSGYPPPQRIRGLDSPTLSRGFFKTVLPSDNYNTDRITVASGPNNLLFGTGSPGGVVDSSLARAIFRNSARFGTRFDSHGLSASGRRSAFSHRDCHD